MQNMIEIVQGLPELLAFAKTAKWLSSKYFDVCKIIEAFVGTSNFWVFLKLHTLWVLKKLDIVPGFTCFGY